MSDEPFRWDERGTYVGADTLLGGGWRLEVAFDGFGSGRGVTLPTSVMRELADWILEHDDDRVDRLAELEDDLAVAEAEVRELTDERDALRVKVRGLERDVERMRAAVQPLVEAWGATT